MPEIGHKLYCASWLWPSTVDHRLTASEIQRCGVWGRTEGYWIVAFVILTIVFPVVLAFWLSQVSIHRKDNLISGLVGSVVGSMLWPLTFALIPAALLSLLVVGGWKGNRVLKRRAREQRHLRDTRAMELQKLERIAEEEVGL